MKKFLSPIFYSLSVFVVEIVLFLIFFGLATLFNYFKINTTISLMFILFLAVVFIIFAFLFINNLIKSIEKIQKPFILDHFRQCSVIYLSYIIAKCLPEVDDLVTYTHRKEAGIYFFISVYFILGAVAIFINVIYLIYVRYKFKKNILKNNLTL